MSTFHKSISATTLALPVVLVGCVTTELLENKSYADKRTVRQTLVDDQLVAFGCPATSLPLQLLAD